ncbi:hypothetical protein MBLNU13_g10443t1 [Cladosporium sp. NU13]
MRRPEHDGVAQRTEHRRIVAYYDSVTNQFKTLQLKDPDIYRRRAAYHYDLTKRKPRSTGRDYESCDNCELVAHTRRHLQYALDACNAEFELDLVRYGLDHPVVEETIRRSAEIREKKAQFHSPKLR